MACSYQTHSPSPLSGRVRTSNSEKSTQSSSTKDQCGASGLFKRLLTMKLTRKANTTKASNGNGDRYTHPYKNEPSRYEQDSLVQRVSEALLLHGSRRRHARSDSFSSTSSSSSGDTPSLYSGSSSGASTPYSSVIFTPLDTPSQSPSKKVERRKTIYTIPPEGPQAIFDEVQAASRSPPPLTHASDSSDAHPAKRTIKYRRATPSQTTAVIENTGLIDLSCQPFNRPLNRPARSKASALHAALRNREMDPLPSQTSFPVSSSQVFKLPPLPRYNPFVRPRAESLSSLNHCNPIKYSSLPQSPVLTRSRSAPTVTEGGRSKAFSKASFIPHPDPFFYEGLFL
ncbi:hypothetical protein QCA50_002368 [Cerrena zonata]|uniref:Uncharacterized protein n=1 Tax=Cerrena zonata TaxID=2478898 RepID=A0AAW0GWS7_9APHY